jgi:hypothetical protein
MEKVSLTVETSALVMAPSMVTVDHSGSLLLELAFCSQLPPLEPFAHSTAMEADAIVHCYPLHWCPSRNYA